MNHDGELCATLPISQLGVTLWYCHVHQGWYGIWHTASQTNDDVSKVTQGDISFGPFDDEPVVERWFTSLAEHIGILPTMLD